MKNIWLKRIDEAYSPGFFDEMKGYGSARSSGTGGIDAGKRIRRRYRFAGRVQGVGFRYRARNAASRLGLTGWVTNCYDGSVEMEIQGTEDEINLAIQNTVTDSYIRIDVMDYFDVPVEEHEYDFYIK